MILTVPLGTAYTDHLTRPDERLVDVHIKNLRRKLGADPARYIDTVRGVGYRMAEQ